MRQLTSHAVRLIWLAVGLVALALGVLGVVLPLLPTVPFILLAAFAFAESSERLHTWLVEHNLFGAMIADWRHHRAISLRAKIASVVAMVAVFVISVLHAVPGWLLAVQAVVLGICAVFIVSRPLPPEA